MEQNILAPENVKAASYILRILSALGDEDYLDPVDAYVNSLPQKTALAALYIVAIQSTMKLKDLKKENTHTARMLWGLLSWPK